MKSKVKGKTSGTNFLLQMYNDTDIKTGSIVELFYTFWDPVALTRQTVRMNSVLFRTRRVLHILSEEYKGHRIPAEQKTRNPCHSQEKKLINQNRNGIVEGLDSLSNSNDRHQVRTGPCDVDAKTPTLTANSDEAFYTVEMYFSQNDSLFVQKTGLSEHRTSVTIQIYSFC